MARGLDIIGKTLDELGYRSRSGRQSGRRSRGPGACAGFVRGQHRRARQRDAVRRHLRARWQGGRGRAGGQRHPWSQAGAFAPRHPVEALGAGRCSRLRRGRRQHRRRARPTAGRLVRVQRHRERAHPADLRGLSRPVEEASSRRDPRGRAAVAAAPSLAGATHERLPAPHRGERRSPAQGRRDRGAIPAALADRHPFRHGGPPRDARPGHGHPVAHLYARVGPKVRQRRPGAREGARAARRECARERAAHDRPQGERGALPRGARGRAYRRVRAGHVAALHVVLQPARTGGVRRQDARPVARV